MPRGRPRKLNEIVPGGEVDKSKPEYTVKNYLDEEQKTAIKRIYTIADGHYEEKYIDPIKCEILSKIRELCVSYFNRKKEYPYTYVPRD